MDPAFEALSAEIGEILTQTRQTISVAESCTGGLLSHVLTGVSGSSGYFIGGVVAYSNRIKEAILGVRSDTLELYGAVSTQTAHEMADGIRTRFKTDIGLSTTGIAGPTGGTPEKPVGLVWIGISRKNVTRTVECHFDGDREQIKYYTVQKLLSTVLSYLK